MKRTISTILGAILLMTGGQALAAPPPVAPVGLSAGLGCGAQCIKKALVTPSMTGGSLEVKTDTPARIKIWVSDQAPGSIDGMPWIPNPDDYLETWSYYLQHTFSLDSLTAGTLYHILVTATDSEGRTAYRLGTFRTLDPPPLPPAVQGQTVRVTFFKVKILNDADKRGRGEIILSFNIGNENVRKTNEMKFDSGQSYRPPLEAHSVSIEDGQTVALTVRGKEFDGDLNDGHVFHYHEDSDRSTAVALLDPNDLADQVYDGDYGGMPFGHDAYFMFESPPRDYLEFRVYAWVDIVD